MGPLRTMRAPITTNSAIDPNRLPLVTLAEWITAATIPAAASTTADTSMLRQGGRHQRFQASVQAATAGTHITDASHAYVARSCRSVHATIALLRRLAAMSARAMLAKTRKPLWLLRDWHPSTKPMSANMPIGSITSTT